MKLTCTHVLVSALVLAWSTSFAQAQAQGQQKGPGGPTVEQHNGPGGPKEKIENLLSKSGLQLPQAPATPPSTSTSTANSPPSAPPSTPQKKN